MTIKQHGGVFGRNPTFNDVSVEGDFSAATVSDLGVVTTADINGGTMDGVTINDSAIGGSTPAAGSFTTITGSGDMAIDTDTLFVDVSENRVGMGTSSPENVVHCKSDTPIPLKLERTTDADSYISYKTTTDEWTAGIDTSEGFVIANGSSITINPRVTIDSSGNIRHGVAGSGNGILDINPATGSYIIDYINGAGGRRFVVNATSGDVQNLNNSYGALSDVKLKENIVDATPKLDDLLQVRIVNYNLKEQPEQKLLGVVAQEVETVFPGIVSDHPDEHSEGEDSEGNDIKTTTKSVKYSVFVPMLIKAIQEQQEQINELKAEVAALKGN